MPPSYWLNDPKLFGVDWLHQWKLVSLLAGSPFVAAIAWLLSYRERRPFNAAALPADAVR